VDRRTAARRSRPDTLLARALTLTRVLTLAGALALVAATLAAVPAAAGTGGIDPAFGVNGQRTFGIGRFDSVAAVLPMPDGDIAVVGSGGDADVAVYVEMFHADGSYDETFGLAGVAFTQFPVPVFATAAVVDPDGRIVVAGYTADAASDVVVLRYTPTGQLDPTFGAGGGVFFVDLGGVDQAFALARRPDGRFVAAGRRDTAAALLGFTAAGLPDPTFGAGGAATFAFGTDAELDAVALQSDGRIVASGRSAGASDRPELLVARFTATGALDPTYGGDGRADLAGTPVVSAIAMVVGPGDRTVVAGSEGDEGAAGLAAVTPAGALDTSFGIGGTTTIHLGAHTFLTSLVLDGTHLVAGGRSSPTFEPPGDLAVPLLVRVDGAGVLDPGFGCRGTQSFELAAAGGGVVAALAVQPDGGLYTASLAFTDTTVDLAPTDVVLTRHRLDAPSSGYVVARADGGVSAFGAAGGCGSLAGLRVEHPITGIAADPDGSGYWLVADDGGVFAFGAPFVGSTGSVRLNRPIVGMAADPDGSGYWVVADDGGVFAFGAPFVGSTGSVRLNRPIVGMAADPDGSGYWLVADDGGVFAFDAPFSGSLGSVALDEPIVGIVADPDGVGYRLVAADGGVFAFDATYEGSTGGFHLGARVVGAA
jgi:uncharacterized delta-60 repeat protein